MHVAFRFPGHLLAGLLLVLLSGRLAAQAPVITTQPQSQTVQAGTVVSFTTEAIGTEPLIYQYYFNDTLFSSYTNGLISLPVLSVLEAGTYLAVVTNPLGSATSAPAVLTVIGPPAITTQPANQAVFVGQLASFSTTVVSPDPPTYQWFFKSAALADATNLTLILPNVTTNEAGTYQIRVSNTNGTTQSLFALLTVNPLPAASLRFGELTATNRIRVPVLFNAHGTETNLSFSASWNPATFTNAAFEPDLRGSLEESESVARRNARTRPASLPADTLVTTDDSELAAGRLGVSLAWAVPTLNPGEGAIGQLVFDLVNGVANPMAGRLSPTNIPVAALFAPPVDGETNVLLNPMNPQLISVGSFSLNRQTGFQEQEIVYGNPGNLLVENSRLTVSGLGRDSRTNAIVLANSQGVLLDPVIPYLDLGAIAPAEIRQALLQYYVTDRVTLPTPTFDLFATPFVVIPPPDGTLLDDVVTRHTNGLVLVEFPTSTNRRYYIEYAPSLAGFTNGGFNTSLPPVIGTGSRRQWLDTGPPRTATLPVGESRFYRVVELQ